jgi:hypothetical protein
MKNRLQAIVLVALLAAGAKGWAATVINFDPPTAGDLPASLSAMGNSPGSAVPAIAQLSNQYNTGSTTDGVLFSSSSPYVAVVNATNPTGIGGVTSDGLLSYADPVIFTFVVPGTTTPGVTSNFSIQADATGIPGQFATVTAFDINGQVLDTVTLNDIGSEVWSIDLPGIHSARFDFPTTSTGALTTGSAFGSGTGIALDNLTFGTVTAASTGTPSAVPLPPMAWGGLLVIGSLIAIHGLHRRKVNG